MPAATMAISTPLRTPRLMTPSIAISANRNSMWLVCQRRRSSFAEKIECGRGNDGPQGSDRQVLHRIGKSDQDEGQHCRGYEAGNLGPTADSVIDRCSGVGAAHREASKQSGGDVRRSEADQFAIGVYPIPIFRTEAARGNDTAAEADNKDTKRLERQIVKVDPLR